MRSWRYRKLRWDLRGGRLASNGENVGKILFPGNARVKRNRKTRPRNSGGMTRGIASHRALRPYGIKEARNHFARELLVPWTRHETF
jgi:hypothetical protein